MLALPNLLSHHRNNRRTGDARARFLAQKRQEMLSFHNDNINILVQLIQECESASPHTSWQDKTITYEQFKLLGQDPRLPQDGLLVPVIFSPKVFFSLPKDESGAIFTSMLFDFTLEYRAQRLTRIDLADFDEDSTGHLTPPQLRGFVERTCANKLRDIDKERASTYHEIITRRFCFLLQNSQQRVAIPTLLMSPMLAELKDAFRETNPVDNWFSIAHMDDLIYVFDQLDVDHSGGLSRQEFSRIRLGRLNHHPSVTDLVVDRIFECKFAHREMDFMSFLDFVLASHNKHATNALRYFWQLVDLHHAGALTMFTLTCFLREVKNTAIATGYAYHDKGVSVESVCNEVFDLFPERQREHEITWQEFKQNKLSAATVITMLTDPNGFVDYDTREARLQQKQYYEEDKDELNDVI